MNVSSTPVGHGEDDGPGSRADYNFPGSVGHGDPKHQRRPGGGRPCKLHTHTHTHIHTHSLTWLNTQTPLAFVVCNVLEIIQNFNHTSVRTSYK